MSQGVFKYIQEPFPSQESYEEKLKRTANMSRDSQRQRAAIEKARSETLPGPVPLVR